MSQTDGISRAGAALLDRGRDPVLRNLTEEIRSITYVHTHGDPKRFLYVSPGVEQLLGYPQDCWYRQSDFAREILHPDDRERMEAECARAAVRTSLESEYRLVAADDRVVWVWDRSALLRDASTSPGVWKGVSVDVTDLREPRDRSGETGSEIEDLEGERSGGAFSVHIAETIEAVKTYLVEHIDEQIDLNSLSRAVALSPHYLSRVFKAHTGVPPHRYLLLLRLERARELLRGSSLSVTQIAHRVGFGTVSHFITTFRRHVGTTPVKFRRRALRDTHPDRVLVGEQVSGPPVGLGYRWLM